SGLHAPGCPESVAHGFAIVGSSRQALGDLLVSGQNRRSGRASSRRRASRSTDGHRRSAENDARPSRVNRECALAGAPGETGLEEAPFSVIPAPEPVVVSNPEDRYGTSGQLPAGFKALDRLQSFTRK